MQKNINFFFLVLGVPTYGEGGGGSTWLGQKTKFFDRFNLRSPLNINMGPFRGSINKESPVEEKIEERRSVSGAYFPVSTVRTQSLFQEISPSCFVIIEGLLNEG